MAHPGEAFRLLRKTWSVIRQVRGPIATSSQAVGFSLSLSDSSLSLLQSKRTIQSLLSSEQRSHLGFHSSMGRQVSRVISNGFDEQGLGMGTWSWRSHQHVATAAEDSKPAEETTQEEITLTDSCIRRIQEIKLEDGPQGENKMLRLSVEGGGCSGFLYNFTLDDKVNKDDRVFEKNGSKLVVDDISYGFIKGATVDFTEELIRASFAVTINPNASSACGCGASFNAKSYVGGLRVQRLRRSA